MFLSFVAIHRICFMIMLQMHMYKHSGKYFVIVHGKYFVIVHGKYVIVEKFLKFKSKCSTFLVFLENFIKCINPKNNYLQNI